MINICEICGAEAYEFKEYRGINEDNNIEVEIFFNMNILRCRECGHCHCNANIDYQHLTRYYEFYYWKDRRKGFGILKRYLRRIVPLFIQSREIVDSSSQSIVDLIDSFSSNKYKENSKKTKILEIGAGAAGITRGLIKKYNSGALCEAYVIEPTDEFEYIYNHYNIRHTARTMEELTYFGPYNLIASRHTLEHITNLDNFFRKLHNLLES